VLFISDLSLLAILNNKKTKETVVTVGRDGATYSFGSVVIPSYKNLPYHCYLPCYNCFMPVITLTECEILERLGKYSNDLEDSYIYVSQKLKEIL